MDNTPIVVPTPINPVEIKGAIAFSAEHARVWAEGKDEEVEKLGGEHSAKGWAEIGVGGSKQYTDEQIANARVEITEQINTNSTNTLNQAKAYTDSSVANEASLRQSTDNLLQSQIDAITSASDVFDVVGTYQDLLEYDTEDVPVNDIIKVLLDSTHDNAASYYRWDGTQWNYIGSEGASYTKAEADALFATKAYADSTYITQAYADNLYLSKTEAVNTYATKVEVSQSYVPLSQKGVASGVATLDANGQITGGQINYATASRIGGIKQTFDDTTGTWTVTTESV